jgi:hypothetical protein
MNLSRAGICAKVVKLAITKNAKSKNLIIVVFLSFINKREFKNKDTNERDKTKYYAIFIKKVHLTNNFEKTTYSVYLKK